VITLSNNNILVLLSGGIDSTVALWKMKEQGYNLYTITFNYFKRFSKEIKCCSQISKLAGTIEHKTINLDFLSEFEDEIYSSSSSLYKKDNIFPPNYISFRNLIFYSLAAWYAETHGIEIIVGGHNKNDINYFPDTSINFFEDLTKLFNFSTYTSNKIQYNIFMPLHKLTKTQVLEEAIRLKVPLDLTWSCEKQENFACGLCRSCTLRLTSFKKINMTDPIQYDD